MNIIHSLKGKGSNIMNSKVDFINGDTKKCFISMSIPMLIAMYLNMAYNIVDSVWIGNLLGETAYAALTNSTPIILILTSIGMGATNGISILTSQALGKGDKNKVNNLISTSLISAIIFPICITAFLELILKRLLIVLNTPVEVFKMAYEYLSIYILGYLSVYLFLYFTAILRSFGNSMFQAGAILISTILNAILDPIFINIVGFQGAAVATVVSQSICLVFMILYIYKKKVFKVNIKLFDKRTLSEIIKKAIPSIIQQSIPAVSTAFLTALVSSYGITAIAGYGITGKLETILLYPAMALNMVLTTIIGQCIGGKRIDKAKSYLKCSIFYGALLLIILSILIVAFAKQLSGLFIDSVGASKIVSHYFIIVGIGYVLNTITNIFLGTLNGMGKPSLSMFLMVFYYMIIRMPLAFILPYLFGLELNGIWVAVLVSHVAACIAALFTGSYRIRLLTMEDRYCENN